MVLGEGRDLEERDKMLRVSGFGLRDGSWEFGDGSWKVEFRI